MSIAVMDLVWKSDIGPVNKRAVLLALADNANDGGYCKPGVAYLVGKTMVARSTVFRLLDQLENEDGLLERRERRRANGSRRSNAYRINLEALAARRRIVSQEEVDELASLFDDDEDGPESAGPAHSPAAGPCGGAARKPAGRRHGPGAGRSAASSRSGTGGGPGAGRAGGPGAGPLEPSGGSSVGAVAAERPPADTSAAPTPQLRPAEDDPDTWLCGKHLAAVAADPGAHIGPCGDCRRVRRAMERRVAETSEQPTAVELLAAEEAGQACGMCRGYGPRTDGLGTRWQRVHPDGFPVTPSVACDHVTPHDAVMAQLAERDAALEAARVHTPPAPPRRPGEAARRAALAAAVPRRLRSDPAVSQPGAGTSGGGSERR